MPRLASLVVPAVLALGLLGGGAEQALAAGKEYNQRPFLAPGESAKVQRVISRGRSMQGNQAGVDGEAAINPNQSIVNTGCGKLSVGNVQTSDRPGARAPRENIVVAREIINAPINCGTRGRR
jgi:hypothetical protein